MMTVDLREADPSDRAGMAIPRPDPGPEPLEAVRKVIGEVRSRGDLALIELTERFDGAKIDALRVDPGAIRQAAQSCPAPLMAALEEAAGRIRQVAERQRLQPWTAEVGGGKVGETIHPVERAGIYVPGGRATYPSSVLMCGVPARVAGVASVALCTPPGLGGEIASATLAACYVAGVDEVYRVGGAQAVAALAYGTASIAPVDLIVGPGNIYVALAKREVAGTVQIDSVAGPSEIAIVAGPAADAAWLAADLVAQAEHGPHGSFLLITWEEKLLRSVEDELEALRPASPLSGALAEGLAGVLVAGVEEAIEVVNRFAPEHVELIFEGAGDWIGRVQRAGAVFAGPWSPVSLGDYLAGSNHVLPTAGAARSSSGLRTSHFQRASAFVAYDEEALRRSFPFVQALADAEGLPNHARALAARLGLGAG